MVIFNSYVRVSQISHPFRLDSTGILHVVGIRGTGLSRPIASRLPGAWWAWCWCCEIGSPAGIDYVYVVPSMAMGQN